MDWGFAGPVGRSRGVAGGGRAQERQGRGGHLLKVSYDKQIRPIFQARCQGCHQPAKAGGGYVMTAFDRLLKGGESDDAAIVPGKPAESHLVEQITPGKDGKAEMPQNKPALSAGEIELITRWIAARGERRHAAERPGPLRHGTSAGIYPAPGDPGPGVLAGRIAAGRRRVPRGLALEGGRLRARRPAGRSVGTRRVAGLLARRQEAGRHGRAGHRAWARCRSGTWPSASSLFRCRSPTTRSMA